MDLPSIKKKAFLTVTAFLSVIGIVTRNPVARSLAVKIYLLLQDDSFKGPTRSM